MTEPNHVVIEEPPGHDTAQWHCHTKLEKFNGDSTNPEDLYEVIEVEGNALLFGGASALFHRLIGGTSITAFDNANTRLGVGDNSATQPAGAQQDLVGTNKLRKGMEAGYPLHTDATGTTGGTSMAVRAVFGPTEANFVWNEWGIFNGTATTGGSGRMLNRRVEAMGTKVANTTWQLTVTVSLATAA